MTELVETVTNPEATTIDQDDQFKVIDRAETARAGPQILDSAISGKLLQNEREFKEHLMRRKRRNHSPAFKAKVALAAVKNERTLAELSQQFDVHANQITQWKRQLVEGAQATFDNESSAADSQAHVAELHAKIGELSMERDFLERGLARFDTKRGGS